MKRKIFDWLSNWLMENGSEHSEIDYSHYSKNWLFVHAFYQHHINFMWEEVYIFLGWRIVLFSYKTRKDKS